MGQFAAPPVGAADTSIADAQALIDFVTTNITAGKLTNAGALECAKQEGLTGFQQLLGMPDRIPLVRKRLELAIAAAALG